MKAHALTATVVLAAVVAGTIFYSMVVGMSWGGRGIQLQPVVEGVLLGAASLLTWSVARTRAAAGLGLLLVGIFILLGVNLILPVESFVHAPIGWVLATVLVARLVRGPDRRDRDPQELSTREQTSSPSGL